MPECSSLQVNFRDLKNGAGTSDIAPFFNQFQHDQSNAKKKFRARFHVKSRGFGTDVRDIGNAII